MIIVDINLLLYAELDATPAHASARRWWEDVMNGDRQVGIPPVSLFGFVRISTNRRVFVSPLSIDDALGRVREWLERPHVAFLTPGPRHLEIAFGYLEKLGSAANLTSDVQIAAHAIESGGEVFSNDRDFARFPGLRWTNPLS
ncbi:MAG: type II toxin-antitoxin system VapC family toxin [Myxococcales bacterium]|nr:type II toxin-antitoxin system VapC family toxin [Myxococcales bacterium]